MSVSPAQAPLGTARFRRESVAVRPTRSSRPSTSRAAPRAELLTILVLGSVLAAGQWGRGLVTMDDLREAEVALEMERDGDFLVPHLAGLPFVEKPPGFPALVAGAYRIAGGPSANAGRIVSVGFAGLLLLGTYLLGLRTGGRRIGLTAASLVALSPLFCRVSHEILLDNALAATVVFAQLFFWESAAAGEPRRSRRASLAAGFCLGLSFLVKGFVGPALVASGLLTSLAWTRSGKHLRAWAHPLVFVGFFVPALLWAVPFVVLSDPSLPRAFFVDNHLGRFARAFDGHARPPYFYLHTAYKLGMAALLFIPGAISAIRRRSRDGGGEDLFLLSLSLGPLILLSVASGKEAIYLLPAYPVFALVGASWLDRTIRRAGFSGRAIPVGLVLVAGAAAAAAVVRACRLGPAAASVTATVLSLSLALGVGVLRRGAAREWTLVAAAQVLGGLACLLSVWGPAADREDAEQEWRPVVRRLLAEAGDGEIVLCWPTDELRGALGFYRGRPPHEVRSTREVLEHLTRTPESIAVVNSDVAGVIAERAVLGPPGSGSLRETLQLPYRGKTLSVLRIDPASSIED